MMLSHHYFRNCGTRMNQSLHGRQLAAKTLLAQQPKGSHTEFVCQEPNVHEEFSSTICREHWLSSRSQTPLLCSCSPLRRYETHVRCSIPQNPFGYNCGRTLLFDKASNRLGRVFQPTVIKVSVEPTLSQMESLLIHQLDRSLEICDASNQKLVVVDCGGYVAPLLHKHFAETQLQRLVKGVVEITKQGVWRAEMIPKLAFPRLSHGRFRTQKTRGPAVR